MVIGFIAAWYAGVFFDFFPFYADDLSIRATGYTGLLLCIVLVLCTARILRGLKKNSKKEE